MHEALAAGLARALLERRSPEDAVALLEPLVADRPHDEPLHRVLMEALDRAGRRWDALDVYERLCRVLDEEYGGGSGGGDAESLPADSVWAEFCWPGSGLQSPGCGD